MECNIEIYKKGICKKRAKWKNTRWPKGLFCDDHKKEFEKFRTKNEIWIAVR